MVLVYEELLDRWEVPRPRSVSATTWGWNNDTFVVASAAGRHVLRISATASRAEAEFEHELLSRLSTASLTFATPRPLPSRDGGTIEMFETRRGLRPATLYLEIPGRHANDEDIDLIAGGAAAFGQLDHALATIKVSARSRPLSSDLATVSPAVPTLKGIERDVGLDAARVMRRAEADAAGLSPTLPRQLIHGDFALGNVLLDGTRVAGIVDFEFSGHDVRAMELATALGLVLTKGTADQLWRPVVVAYLRALPLTDEEISVLPALTRLGRAIGLLWWIGREREGRSSKTATAERVERVLAIDTWISRNSDLLVETASRAR